MTHAYMEVQVEITWNNPNDSKSRNCLSNPPWTTLSFTAYLKARVFGFLLVFLFYRRHPPSLFNWPFNRAKLATAIRSILEKMSIQQFKSVIRNGLMCNYNTWLCCFLRHWFKIIISKFALLQRCKIIIVKPIIAGVWLNHKATYFIGTFWYSR